MTLLGIAVGSCTTLVFSAMGIMFLEKLGRFAPLVLLAGNGNESC